MEYPLLNKHFKSITSKDIDEHTAHWQGLIPSTAEEIWSRIEFAGISPRVTYSVNVKAFKYLSFDRDLHYNSYSSMLKALKHCGTGIYKVKTKCLLDTYSKYVKDPRQFLKQQDETWQTYRNRITAEVYGLGYAKASFAVELLYPLQAEVVCLDTHILKLFGIKNRSIQDKEDYQAFEHEFLLKCKELNIPPPIARNIIWNELVANAEGLDFWTHCFRSYEARSP